MNEKWKISDISFATKKIGMQSSSVEVCSSTGTQVHGMQCLRLKLEYYNVMKPFIYDPIKKCCFQRINFPLVFLLQFISRTRFISRAIALKRRRKSSLFSDSRFIWLTRRAEWRRATTFACASIATVNTVTVSKHSSECTAFESATFHGIHTDTRNEQKHPFQRRVFDVHLCLSMNVIITMELYFWI